MDWKFPLDLSQLTKSLRIVTLKGDHNEISYNLVTVCHYRFNRL